MISSTGKKTAVFDSSESLELFRIQRISNEYETQIKGVDFFSRITKEVADSYDVLIVFYGEDYLRFMKDRHYGIIFIGSPEVFILDYLNGYTLNNNRTTFVVRDILKSKFTKKYISSLMTFGDKKDFYTHFVELNEHDYEAFNAVMCEGLKNLRMISDGLIDAITECTKRYINVKDINMKKIVSNCKEGKVI